MNSLPLLLRLMKNNKFAVCFKMELGNMKSVKVMKVMNEV